MAPVVPQFLTRPVVVGVSEDERSHGAVHAALAWASWSGAALHLVHGTVPQRALWGARGADDERGYLERIRSALAAPLDALAEEAHDGLLSSRLTVRAQRPDRALIDVAREVEAGLVVVGKHRRRGVLDLGDTARSVLAEAVCPVWCQHEAPADRPIERILVPVDLSETSVAALLWARSLADTLGAKLRVLHAFAAPVLAYAPAYGAVPPTYVVDEERAAARQAFESFGAEYSLVEDGHELVFAESDPHDAILMRESDADLLVLGTHGRTGVRAMLLGSVAYGVLREAQRPVVAVPNSLQDA